MQSTLTSTVFRIRAGSLFDMAEACALFQVELIKHGRERGGALLVSIFARPTFGETMPRIVVDDRADAVLRRAGVFPASEDTRAYQVCISDVVHAFLLDDAHLIHTGPTPESTEIVTLYGDRTSFTRMNVIEAEMAVLSERQVPFAAE